jgi:hypothetical protein
MLSDNAALEPSDERISFVRRDGGDSSDPIAED